MATRIHNFSYSGGTGLLTFVPCTGSEVACKVYIKAIRADVNTYGDSGVYVRPEIKLSSKTANNAATMPRAYWRSLVQGSTTKTTMNVNLTGGCNSISQEWFSNAINNQQAAYTDANAATFIELIERIPYSGTGFMAFVAPPSSWIYYNIPEYFYLRPNDTLTMEGYTGTFHIELMAISET